MSSSMELMNRLMAFVPADLKATIRTSFTQLRTLYEMDRHFELSDLFDSIVEQCHLALDQLSREPPSALRASDEASPEVVVNFIPSDLGIRLVLEQLKSSEMYLDSKEKTSSGRSLLSDVENHSTWTATSSVNASGHGTYYRAEQGVNSHSFKVVGVVDQGMNTMASVLIELDMYKEWFPFCNLSEEAGSPHRFHKYGRFAIHLPWPMANREVFLSGYGIDHLLENKVIICATSVDEREKLPSCVTYMPPKKGNVVALLRRGGFVLEAISQWQTKVSFVMNVDPQLKSIPMPLINWVSGKMIWVLLHQMEKAAREGNKKDSKYAIRRRTRPELYGYLAQRALNVFGWVDDDFTVQQ